MSVNDTTDYHLVVTQPLDDVERKLRINANGDGTYSISAALTTQLIPKVYDTVIINYTDATKAVISTVVYKTGGASGTTVATLTYTSASTSDTYVRT